MRRRWKDILQAALEIVNSYDTPVTLRQLFYRLVSIELLKNTRSEYNQLSDKTARARREGWFPDFIDRDRSIHKYQDFSNPEQAQEWLVEIYRRNRTEGQEYSIYLGVEKAGIINQLQSWFGGYGVPILALKGYSSQTYVKEIKQHAKQQGRPAILIYAGDFDPSGEDILRDFRERADCFTEVHRVALTEIQVLEYDLPPQMGKATDTRAAKFIEKYGSLIQVELDALTPDIIFKLYSRVFNQYFDMSTFESVLKQEEYDRALLREAI